MSKHFILSIDISPRQDNRPQNSIPCTVNMSPIQIILCFMEHNIKPISRESMQGQNTCNKYSNRLHNFAYTSVIE